MQEEDKQITQDDMTCDHVDLLVTSNSNRNTSKRDRIVIELLMTERSYLESMNTLYQEYCAPLKDTIRKSKEIDEITLPRATNELLDIFASIELIVSVNTELCSLIEERVKQWHDNQLIADIFLHMADFLKVYKKYCSTYENSSEYIIAALRDRQDLANFMRDANEKARRRLTVPSNVFSFLIMPVQRLPRYVLLFQELLKETSTTHPDYENLQQAVNKAKEISTHIDEDVTSEEHRQKMVEIQKRFILSSFGLSKRTIIAPHRKYIKEGAILLENTASVPGKFYLYLFNDILATAAVASHKKSFLMIQELHSIIPLQNAWIVEETDNDKRYLWKSADRSCFAVLTPEANFVFRCSSPDERRIWTDAIGLAISSYLSLRPEVLSTRSVSFPILNQKNRWRFGPLQLPSLSYQMAKHIYIRNMPPGCLLATLPRAPSVQRVKSEDQTTLRRLTK